MDRLTCELFEACRNGNKDDAAVALAFGARLNAANATGMTPLMTACWYRSVLVVDLLLRMPGVIVNATTPDGHNALHFVASPCGATAAQNSGIEIVRLLVLSGKADLNAQGATHGETPLMRAIASGQADVAGMLITAPGADLMARDSRGRSAIDWAVACNQPESYDNLMLMLKQTADILFFDEPAAPAPLPVPVSAVQQVAPPVIQRVKFTPCYPSIYNRAVLAAGGSP